MNNAHLSLLSTNISWQKLALSNETTEQINKLKDLFLTNKAQLETKGQIILLYGADTKTKIDVAALLGKEVNKPLYSINLAAFSSTYIGETEKNIKIIWQDAQKAGAILFFDEADALFGKRTKVKDPHDKYANLEVSYLLQKLEDYNGITIISTKIKANIDAAFTRRFHSIIYF